MAKQTGSEYREKNRIRLQRFYERQTASGKKRISALISGDTHSRMMDEKDRTGMPISGIIEAALNQRYGDQDMTRFNESSAGHDGIPDVDDMSGDYLTAYSGPDPETPSGESQEPAVVEPETADTGPNLEVDQGDPNTDDTTGQDQAEPAALVDQEPVTEILPEREQDTHIDEPDQEPQGDDLIPDCTGKTISRDERDKILVQVAEALPGPSNAQARVDLLNRKGVPVYVESRQYPYGGEWDRKKFTDNLSHAKKRLGVK